MLGYSPHHVRDARTALALLLGGRQFDIAFSDIVMPGGMDGVELARRLRQHFPRLPILLASGFATVTAEAYAAGFEVIAKPYSAAALADALARTIEPARGSQRETA